MNVVYALHLFDYHIGPFVISDLALLFLILTALLRVDKFTLRTYHIVLLLFWFSALIISLSNMNEEYFSIASFILSFSKFSLYIISLFILPPFFKENYEKLNKIIKNSVVIMCVLGLYQFISHYVFPFFPYSFTHPLISNRHGLDSMISYGGQFRIRSIFSEPAHFSIYLTILYFYLVKVKKATPFVHILVFISVILTLSMGGLALLILVYFINFLRNLVHQGNFKVITCAVLGILIFGLFAFTNDYITSRISNISSLKEGSATTRLLGGWEYALNTPVSGIGFGNVENYYNQNLVSEDLSYAKGNVHNILALTYIISGVVGLFLFVLFILLLFQKSVYSTLFIFATFFAWGAFNTTNLWFILILFSVYDYYINNKLKNKIP
jgi:hypothetical protein